MHMCETVTIDGVQIPIEKLEALGFVKKEEKEWPLEEDIYYFIQATGSISKAVFFTNSMADEECLKFFNCFRTIEQAKKAAKLMRRHNAMIRAKMEVDLDYEPVWNANTPNFIPRYDIRHKK